MTNKRIKLPKEGLREPEAPSISLRVTDDDVEGHSFATPAPPALTPSRSPSHGGEFIPGDEDDDWKGLNK
jgi:hypothetical protein